MAKGLAQAAGKPSLDMAMAGLAAASVGFVMFAMPDPVFADLVTASGLPALISAAEPPLGATARLASVVAAAAGTFLLVWLALRALNQPSATPKAAAPKAVAEPEAPISGRRRNFIVGQPEPEAPRIRRADAHPDAPARRPLFAGSDLGEPLDEIEADEPEQEWVDDYGAEAADEPLPSFMTGDSPPAAGEEAEEGPVFGEYGWEAVEEAPPATEDAHPVAGDEMDFSTPAFEPEPHEPPAFDPQTYQPHAFAAPEEAEEEPETTAPLSFEPAAPEEPVDTEEEQAEPFSYQPPEVAPMPPREQGEASISELMQRLERGLARRSQVAWEEPAPHAEAPAPEPEQPSGPISPAAVDDRLRSALDDLQKMASRGGQG